MKTILDIPQKAGSWWTNFYPRIKSTPYIALEVIYPSLLASELPCCTDNLKMRHNCPAQFLHTQNAVS
jgi:hypothetical protein